MYPGRQHVCGQTPSEFIYSNLWTVTFILPLQKRALREASQRSKKSVFTVEDEVNGDIHRELSWRERENSTVFVIPETARTSDGCHTWMYLKGTDPDTATLGSVSDLHDGDTTTLDSSSEDTLSRDLERVSLGSLGKWTWDIHSIILDFSTANFIDTVAIKTLRNVSASKVQQRKSDFALQPSSHHHFLL